MDLREKTCCFTGHRSLSGEEKLKAAVRLRRVIEEQIKDGVVFYGAGGALGFDTLAAKTVLDMKKEYPQGRRRWRYCDLLMLDPGIEKINVGVSLYLNSMEVTNRIIYDVEKSAKRMDDILDAGSGNFSDSSSIPARSSLTYTNGHYVNITALFIDIVGSSDMTDEHKRPVLAKLYRSFISECTAIMNSESACKEISINGDCVWGVFETPYTSDIDDVFSVAARLNSMVKILNYKLGKKGYSTISVGIGIDYGRALMVKAGYSGSGLNDVIWMGDVVNSACHIANRAGRDGKMPIVVSSCIHSNLNEENQGFLRSTTIEGGTYYQADVINVYMEEWYEENCT